MDCFELQNVGTYSTDGRDVWLTRPNERMIGRFLPNLLQPGASSNIGDEYLFTDGIVYQATAIQQANDLDILYIQKCWDLTQVANRVSLDYLCQVAPDLGARIRKNWNAYCGNRTALAAHLLAFISLRDLTAIVAIYVECLDIISS